MMSQTAAQSHERLTRAQYIREGNAVEGKPETQRNGEAPRRLDANKLEDLQRHAELVLKQHLQHDTEPRCDHWLRTKQTWNKPGTPDGVVNGKLTSGAGFSGNV